MADLASRTELEALAMSPNRDMGRRWQVPDVDTFDRADDCTDGAPSVDLVAIIARAQPAWMADAACRDADPSLFFPERGQSTEPAKALCATCPTFDACAAYAVDIGARHGIWAGEGNRRKRTTEAA